MEEMIRIEHLTFTYNQETEKESVPAVKDVSLSFPAGSFTAILGKNGSGKSTLAKNLNGLFLPSGGKVYVKNWATDDDEHIWDIRQTAGMVFQNPDNQLVSSIVEDDVAFGPENLGIDPAVIRQRVDQALDGVRMGDYKQKAPHLLSGGQKQRIAIAGVVAMRPDCIIFDEPTAMLDPRGRKEILAVIRQLHQEGITVILITHFMEEAAQADRIVILHEGEVFLDGTPEAIFAQADQIRAIGLDVPMAVEIAEGLRQRGIPVPADIIDAERLVTYLCP